MSDPATRIGLEGYGQPSVNNSGVAVGYAAKTVGGMYFYHGTRPVRWDASGTAVELGILPIDSVYHSGAQASAINDAGTAVGYSARYENGESEGPFAVRWDLSTTVATELGGLGGGSRAYAINNAGTAVGSARKYESGARKGDLAVRWDASGTAATELGIIGVDSRGRSYAAAVAINEAGTAVGSAAKYVGDDYLGRRAVRWDASGTAATELEPLSTDSNGFAFAGAVAVNAAGTAVGTSGTLDPARISHRDDRAVRWDASGTAATKLDSLGTGSCGHAHTAALAINDAGTAVGWANKYDGEPRGQYAVRWDASGTAVTELESLGVNRSGIVIAKAYAINAAGTAVGYSEKYVNGRDEQHAVVWRPDGSVIDLDDLGVVPVSGGGQWWLNGATGLSADGWVAGYGGFLPDGAVEGYCRLWVTQVGLGGTWTGAGGGTWGRGPNWSTGTPAMQVGNATFDLNAAYTVALDRDELTKTMTLDAGTVSIDFSGHTLTTESGLNIAAGATLNGAGTIVSDIINAGTIAPGNSPGTLDIVGDLASTGALNFEIAGLSSHDRINVTGAFTAGGTIEVMLDGYSPISGDSFGLMSFGSFVDDGYLFDFTHAGLSAELEWDTAAFATTGRIGVVPEPSTLALFAAGSIGLLAFTRRRRSNVSRYYNVGQARRLTSQPVQPSAVVVSAVKKGDRHLAAAIPTRI